MKQNCMVHCMHPTSLRRRGRLGLKTRGVSLIEILVAIGIVSVGLLGSLALITAGQHQASQGIISDRTGEVGRNSHREFKIRDMNNPANWVGANGGSIVQGKWEWGGGGAAPVAVVIDPWAVAQRNANVFGLPGIPRISLRASPTATAAMSLQQARHIFEASDDLTFIRPEKGFHLPQQEILNGQRVADNDFSWAAMIARMPEAGNNMYRLSILVYYRRNIPETGAMPERTVDVNMIGGGYGGGDVVLTRDIESLAVNPGEWMMLVGTINGGSIYRWYRIIAADNSVTGGKRFVTLSGPDWDIRSISNTSGIVYAKIGAELQPNGKIKNDPFEGIVGVYEKTIRLQTSSLWVN